MTDIIIINLLHVHVYVQVIVSNTAVNSTGTLIEVTPWPLVPRPLLVNTTNTTIAVKVVLNDSQLYEPITDVSVKVMTVQWCISSRYDWLTFLRYVFVMAQFSVTVAQMLSLIGLHSSLWRMLQNGCLCSKTSKQELSTVFRVLVFTG